MENQIRGAVFSKYKDITAFANDIGWQRKKASRIVNGIQSPSAKDMEQIADCLGIMDADKFISIFFPARSTK